MPAGSQKLPAVSWRALDGVDADELARLVGIARRRTFRSGEIVVHQNDPADSLHLIVAGRFVIGLATPLGDRVTVAVCGPGDIFGEFALIGDDRQRSATVRALEPAETLCVYAVDFDRLRLGLGGPRRRIEFLHLAGAILDNEAFAQRGALATALYP